jgi:hypothetical protein
MAISDEERAEIEEDIRNQGLDITADDVISTFGLHESTQIPDDNPEPFPAFGPDWQYTPEPGEEDLFVDTAGMFLPPIAREDVGSSETESLSDQARG